MFSQTEHDGLLFNRTEFNFQKIENWISRVDTIEVSNTSSKKIFLLKQHYPQEFQVRFPVNGIDPGQTGIIEFIYLPKSVGTFNVSVPVYHSASLTPVNITYKGEVLSFDEFANVECPSFSKVSLRPVEFGLEISVLDSATKKPLSNSQVEVSEGERFYQLKTDDYGKIKAKANIGYYQVLAEHVGYKSKSIAKHVNPKNNKIDISLPSVTESKKIILPPKDSIITAQKEAIPVLKESIMIAQKEIPIIKPADKSDFSITDYKKNNIIFLIDKSASMNGADRMPLLQEAMIQLAKMTRPEDRITIITYANEAKVMLQGTRGNEHEKIIRIIQQLKCGGRTEGGTAIQTAYKNAEQNFIKDGMNQIILATDGGFNGLAEKEDDLMKLVESKKNKQIRFSVLAFGQNKIGKQVI